MNCNEFTFGVEFETTMPIGSVICGGYHRGQQVPWLPEGWNAQHDGSIRARRGRMGVEFVSPVLKGAEGLKQVLDVIDMLVAHGATINQSCGFHIHVGSFGAQDQKTLEKVTTLVANFEKAIFASTGTKAREQGRWCGSIQQYGSTDSAIVRSSNVRYHVLNLTNIPRIGTVEFRAFGGTLNKVKVAGYIQLCLGLVERAVKASRKTNFTAKKPVETSPIARDGEGQTALVRLYYQLGWTKGRTNQVYGDIGCPMAPSIAKIKKEFSRLAKKYDAGR